MPTRLTKIPRSFLRRLRGLLPGNPPSLEFGPDVWDREYTDGKWSYLSSLSEFSRFAVIAGYVRFFDRTASILEVGCGTGVLLGYLTDVGYASYTGIDLSSRAIEDARGLERTNARFEVADGRSYSDGRRHDLVIFNEALYYFDDCVAVLEHYRTNLESGGRFIISMVVGPQSRAHWSTIDKRYEVEDSVRLTNGAGTTWDIKVVRP